MLLPCQNAQFIKNQLDRYVLSQNEATKSLAMVVAQHFLACEYNETCAPDDRISTDNVLIIGSTGVGKSESIKVLKRIGTNYGFIVTFEAGPSYAPSDTWRGNSINQIISKAFQNAGSLFYAHHPDNTNVQFAKEIIAKLTENSIIVIDEADKIMKRTSDDCERSSSHDYQSTLLKLVEGTEIEVQPMTHERQVAEPNPETGEIEFTTETDVIDDITINTQGILWILMGAFEGIEEITKCRIQQENAKNNTTVKHDYYQCCHAGFIQDKSVSTITKPTLTDNSTPVPAPTIDDLVTYGMKRELAGRLPVKIRYNPLNVTSMIKILKDCPTSAYHEYRRRLELMGHHKLFCDNSALKFICENAKAKKTGARSLRQEFNDILSPVMFELSATTEPHICKLTGKRLKNGLPPIIEKLKPQKDTQREEEIMQIINNSKIRKTESA